MSSTQYCGRGTAIGVSPDGASLRFVPLLCNSWTCPRCAPRKAWKWRELIRQAAPSRWMTLTLDTKGFASPVHAFYEFKRSFPSLVRVIRLTYGNFQYVAIYERHKSGWPHLHVAYRGTYIPQKWLSNTWSALTGSRIVDVRAIPNPHVLSRYLTKYLVKAAAATAAAFPRLRVVSASRGFMPDDPDPDHGPSLEEWRWTWTPLPPGDALDALVLSFGFLPGQLQEGDVIDLDPPASIRAPPRRKHEETNLFYALKEFFPCLSTSDTSKKRSGCAMPLLPF